MYDAGSIAGFIGVAIFAVYVAWRIRKASKAKDDATSGGNSGGGGGGTTHPK